jgi:hypothetical protein
MQTIITNYYDGVYTRAVWFCEKHKGLDVLARHRQRHKHN